MRPRLRAVRVASAVILAFAALLQLPTVSAHAFRSNRLLIDLPAALRLAGARNLDVKIARDRLKEAQAKRTSSLERFFPWLAPGVSYQRRGGLAQAVPAGTISPAHFQSYAPGATVAAQMNLGNAIYGALAARQLAHAANHALQAHRQDAMLAAARGYFNLAKDKALVGVAKETLRIARDYQDQLREAVAAGIAFKGDELRAQSEVERDRILLERAREGQRIAAARLAQILHLDPIIELVPKVSDLVPMRLIAPDATLNALVRQALQSRPELQQGRAVMRAARDRKDGATYGPLIPTISAQYFGGGLGGGPDNGPGRFGRQSDLYASVTWRMGPGGLFDFGKIRASQARLDAAQARVEEIHDEISREVVQAWTGVQSLRRQLATARSSLTAADEALRLTQQRKAFGVGVVLENIQAQNDLSRARAEYLNVVATYDKAEYDLNQAIGRPLKADRRQAAAALPK